MRIAIALLLLLAGCASKSPDETLLKDVEPVVSWAATLQMTAEKWLANSVPTRFVTASVGSAQKELEKARQSIDQSPASKELRDKLRQQVEITGAAAGKLRAAVENGDRRIVAVTVSQFAAAHDALEDLER